MPWISKKHKIKKVGMVFIYMLIRLKRALDKKRLKRLEKLKVIFIRKNYKDLIIVGQHYF